MTSRVVVVGNKKLQLGPRIGRGGEGEVFSLDGITGIAVKLYNASERASREQKVAAMVRAQLSNSAPLVAFPVDIVKGVDGVFAGFSMRLVDDHRALHNLYAPGPRKQHFPKADYRFLVRAASNIARAIASVHRAHCVIGDINHSGILVSPKATVALIDADSFQVSEGGKNYFCRVGVPEYTPPELQGQSLEGVVRTPNHDAFGLAIVVFQLLFMGRHPFVGTVRRGDIPPIHENIANFRYVYANNRDVGMDQPPGTPSLSEFSPAIASLFDAAFSSESAGSRPGAEQWVAGLDLLETSLTQCQENKLHFIPREASECAWCEMDQQLGTFLFLPFYVTFDSVSAGTFNALAVDIGVLWKKIDSIIVPTRDSLKPPLGTFKGSPSERAKSAKSSVSNAWGKRAAGVALIAIGVIAILAAPKAFLLFLFLIFFGWSLAISKGDSINTAPFERDFIQADGQFQYALQSWYQRIGFDELEKLKVDLQKSKRDYDSLLTEEKTLVAKCLDERKERHLKAYLDRFDVQQAEIKGIGSAKRAVLASYGIDTAFDVTRAKLLSVPGFGDATAKGLLDWRQNIERKFVYNPTQGEEDRREIALIRASVQAKATSLKRSLSEGAQHLEARSRRLSDNSKLPDPAISRTYAVREQARCDLEFLGGRVSSSSYRTSATPTRFPTSTPATSQPSTNKYGSGRGTQSAATCPRCGSSMVKRLARRGRNSGNYFWGCSRYPGCKGTRNI